MLGGQVTQKGGGKRNVVIAQNTCTSACVLKTNPLAISIGDNGCVTPSFSANSEVGLQGFAFLHSKFQSSIWWVA